MNKKFQVLSVLAVFFLAMNLRAPIVAIGALANVVSEELHLSSGMMGLLTTLTLITFSLASLLNFSTTETFFPASGYHRWHPAYLIR